jgi:hypothetical protein
MLQNDEKATTPRMVDQIRLLTIIDAAPKRTPAIAKMIQLLMPI